MTTAPPIDLDYRPLDYWTPDNWAKHLLANIKGAARRAFVHNLIETGQLSELYEVDEIQEWLLAPDLEPENRELTGRIHPWLMGGEFLPSRRDNAVEIARVTLRSTTMDVISVLAQPAKSRIRYRIVDEYETKYRFRPSSSTLPLTMRQLIQLMDGAVSAEEDDSWPYMGILYGPLDQNLPYLKPAAARSFLRLESEFYPELKNYYQKKIRERVSRWCSVTGQISPCPGTGNCGGS